MGGWNYRLKSLGLKDGDKYGDVDFMFLPLARKGGIDVTRGYQVSYAQEEGKVSLGSVGKSVNGRRASGCKTNRC